MKASSGTTDLSGFARWLAPVTPSRKRLYLAWLLLLAWVAFLVLLYMMTPKANPFGGTGLG